MSTIFLTSTKNVLKRDESSETANMDAPATAYYDGYLYKTTLTIPHNLGYVPVYRYYYEPFGDGVIWPPLTDRNSRFARNPQDLTDLGPGLIAWADSTNLYLELFYFDNTLTGTYPVYYVIYKDFDLS
jgi:hypothetical protein